MKKRSPESPGAPSGSFDIWEPGARDFVRTRVWRWSGRTDLPVIPAVIMDVSRRDRRWFRHVNYPFIAVEMILQGEAEYREEGAPAVRIGPGGYYVVSPGSSVRMVNTGDMVRRKLSLILRGNCLCPVSAALGMARDVYGQAADPEWMEKAMLELGEYMEQAPEAEALSVKAYQFLVEFARMRTRENTFAPQVAEAAAYMQTHFREKIQIRDAAAAQHCSEVTLRRRFAACFRQSPLQWLMALRLEYAACLLRENAVPVKEAAAQCGWRDGAGFAAAFRQRFGVSPAAFREKAACGRQAVKKNNTV